ncbi:MAG TPA: NAD(P)-binding domain-containing protein [Gemmatimonadales bacterium]|jgi:putative flavoprotein involved in K+ transport
MMQTQRIQTVIIGGGQSGLSVGYHLAQRGLPFVILEANHRVGDTWRRRWDSLRLFTPARFDAISGMPFPGPPHAFPTKDEMADYLESYAGRFALPVRTGVKVDRLCRQGDRYIVSAGTHRFEADHVVVAMATFQRPQVPAFAAELDSGILQLHSLDYRNPAQLQDGGVLVVGAGNSGAEIALELSRAGQKVWMSGRRTGEVPFRINGWAARHLLLRPVFRFVFHRVLTTDTPIGRRARPKIVAKGAPLIRVKARDLLAAGVEWVPRTRGVSHGLPILDDDRVLEVGNVIWCTGFHPGFSWIDLPLPLDDHGEPIQRRGVVPGEPGLYFVGLHFLYAMSSTMIHGVSRDAEYIAEAIAGRVRTRVAEPAGAPTLLAAG